MKWEPRRFSSVRLTVNRNRDHPYIASADRTATTSAPMPDGDDDPSDDDDRLKRSRSNKSKKSKRNKKKNKKSKRKSKPEPSETSSNTDDTSETSGEEDIPGESDVLRRFEFNLNTIRRNDLFDYSKTKWQN